LQKGVNSVSVAHTHTHTHTHTLAADTIVTRSFL